MPSHRIFTTPFAKVYQLYVEKVVRKLRTADEVDQVIRWLTGYDQARLRRQIAAQTDFESFFAQAPTMNTKRSLIKGSICRVRIEEIDDPLIKEIRYLDELAKGKPLEKMLPA